MTQRPRHHNPLALALRLFVAAVFPALGIVGYTQTNSQTTPAPQQLAFAGLNSLAAAGRINSVQADSSGNLYLLVDDNDGIRILKTDNAASALLAQIHLGATGDSGVALALNPAGDVFITGTTSSTTLSATANAAIPARTGTATNAFVAGLDSSLNLKFLSFTGGSRISASAIAASGDAIFVTGITFAADLPVTASAIQQTPAYASSESGFVERFNSAGTSLVYATYLT